MSAETKYTPTYEEEIATLKNQNRMLGIALRELHDWISGTCERVPDGMLERARVMFKVAGLE